MIRRSRLQPVRSYARLGQFAEARLWIAEAVSSVKSRNEYWCNSFILHTAGEIELLSNELNIGKALAYSNRLPLRRRSNVPSPGNCAPRGKLPYSGANKRSA